MAHENLENKSDESCLLWEGEITQETNLFEQKTYPVISQLHNTMKQIGHHHKMYIELTFIGDKYRVRIRKVG